MGPERQGRPATALGIALITVGAVLSALFYAWFVFTDPWGGGQAARPDLGILFLAVALAALLWGGLAAWRVGTGRIGRWGPAVIGACLVAYGAAGFVLIAVLDTGGVAWVIAPAALALGLGLILAGVRRRPDRPPGPEGPAPGRRPPPVPPSEEPPGESPTPSSAD